MKLKMPDLLKTIKSIYTYQDNLDKYDVYPKTSLGIVESFLEGSIKEEGVGEGQMVDELTEFIMPYCNHISHPKYFGLVNSSPLPGGILADFFVSALNNNLGAKSQSPSLHLVEKYVLEEFKSISGYPTDSEGIILPGGTQCNLHGILLARQRAIKIYGFEQFFKMKIYISDAVHFSVTRSILVLGFQPDQIIRISSKNRGELDAICLENEIKNDLKKGNLPTAIIGTLGTTGTGAIDPLEELINIKNKWNLWLHLDACYGGAALLTEEFKSEKILLAEIDSLALDAHKWFFVPLTAGVFLTKHKKHLLESFSMEASYIPTDKECDPWQKGIPTSRRGMVLVIWGAFRSHGINKIRDMVYSNIEDTRYLESLLVKEGFKVLPSGRLSVCCARYEVSGLTNDANNLLQSRISEELIKTGDGWFSTVEIGTDIWLRFNLLNIHTKRFHIRELVTSLVRVCRLFY